MQRAKKILKERKHGMTTSKSFRAILPCLSEEEVRRLQAWSAENCAVATVFRESECVVWLASKERARSREAFLRGAEAFGHQCYQAARSMARPR